MELELETKWPETIALLLLVVGFIIAVVLQSPSLSYLAIILSGGLAGRIYYEKNSKVKLYPLILIILGFLVGYFIGTFWVSRILILVLFGISFGVSYYLHLKKIFGTFKSDRFVR
jgi:hypothetical protein